MDPVQPDASVVQTGLGVRYVQNYAYAYSGEITNAGTGSANTDTLNFTSGSGVIVAKFSFTTDEEGSTTQYLSLSFNGIIVYSVTWDNAGASSFSVRNVDIIIPPFTHVVAKMGSDVSNSVTHLITGRVYGVK